MASTTIPIWGNVPGFPSALLHDAGGNAASYLNSYTYQDNTVSDGNDVSVSTSDDVALGDSSDFSFHQIYDSLSDSVVVYLPISIAGADTEFPPFEGTGFVVTSVNVSTMVYNLNPQHIIDLTIESAYNSGLNVTMIDPSLYLSSDYQEELGTGLDAATEALSIAALVLAEPWAGALSIAAVAAGGFGLIDRMMPSDNPFPPSNLTYEGHPDAPPVYQNFSLTGGTWYQNGQGDAYTEYCNEFGINELVEFTIPSSDFNCQGAYVDTVAKNTAELYPSAAGAHIDLGMEIDPSSLLYGQITDNGVSMGNQTVLLTQTDSNGTVTDFYEKTNSLGYYEFYAQRDSNYQIQLVTPNGFAATTNSTPQPIGSTDYNSTELNLNVNTPTITFNENGVPQDDSWSVTVTAPEGSETLSTTYESSGSTTVGDFLEFAVLGNENYQYSIVPDFQDYTANPYIGGLSVGSSDTSVSVTFLPIDDVNFQSSGLPTGTDYTLTFNGVQYNAGSSFFLNNLPLGTYGYSISPPPSYSVNKSSGSITINQPGEYSVYLGFTYHAPPSYYAVKFTESGLPSGTQWGVKLNDVSEFSTTSSLSFSEQNGLYSFTALSASAGSTIYYPSPTSGSVSVSGGPVTKSLTYAPNSCVAASTPILMANGTYKYAYQIHVGDMIATYNLTTHTMMSEQVEYAWQTNQSGMYTVDNYLQIAPDQKILTESGWIEAQNLSLNDTIYNVVTHRWEPVWSIHSQSGTFTMYEFYVYNVHDYIAWWNVMQDKIA